MSHTLIDDQPSLSFPVSGSRLLGSVLPEPRLGFLRLRLNLCFAQRGRRAYGSPGQIMFLVAFIYLVPFHPGALVLAAGCTSLPPQSSCSQGIVVFLVHTRPSFFRHQIYFLRNSAFCN